MDERPLHSAGSLSPEKLEEFRRARTRDLIDSLKPGEPGSLPDGTIMEGHHRVCVLRERGVDVDALPREVVPKSERE